MEGSLGSCPQDLSPPGCLCAERHLHGTSLLHAAARHGQPLGHSSVPKMWCAGKAMPGRELLLQGCCICPRRGLQAEQCPPGHPVLPWLRSPARCPGVLGVPACSTCTRSLEPHGPKVSLDAQKASDSGFHNLKQTSWGARTSLHLFKDIPSQLNPGMD